jgi:SAM-dependent methyltransferase
MDPIVQYNVDRWAALVRNGAVFTRPYLALDQESAREMVDPGGKLGELAGKRVLCLASGGGQQSAAFALLGAEVTVVDLSAAQLARDREATDHYGLRIKLVEADMRDLSCLETSSFDLVYHPYSLNFIPDARVVFREVARVLRSGGLYHFNCANPFVIGVLASDWNRQGYPLRLPYLQGAVVGYEDEAWVFGGERPSEPIHRPREYRHTLGTLVNGLIEHSFLLLGLSEEHFGEPDSNAEPGSSEHWTAVAPPWLRFWAAFRPDLVVASSV